MAEKKEQVINVADTVSRAEEFFKKNQKLLSYIGIGILVAAAGIFGWKYYMHSKDKDAKEECIAAIHYWEKDSLDKAIKGDGQNKGLEDLTDEYGFTPAGNLCYYYLGIAYYKKGRLDDAIETLKNFSSSDNLIAALAFNAIGAAYEDKQEKEKAAKYYEKAAREYDDNDYTPIFLMNAARVNEHLGEKKKALALYKEIKKKYPATMEGREADKYIARIEAVGIE